MGSADAEDDDGTGPWLPWLAAGVMVGCLLPPAALVQPATALLALATAPVLLAGGRPWASRCLAAVLALALGHAYARARAPADDPRDRFVEVSGRVQEVVYRCYGQGFQLVPTMVAGPGGPLPERIFVQAGTRPALREGDAVLIAGRYTGRPRPLLEATRLTLALARDEGPQAWAWRTVDALRRHRGLAACLLLGRGRDEGREAFRRTGLLHLLAVSGMHLGLVLAGCALVLRCLPVPRGVRSCLLAGLALGYGWLTGWSLPTCRSVAMTLAVIAAGLGSRRPHRLGAVSLATLVMALIDPGDLRTASFQISLVAVIGIVTLGRDLIRLARWHLPLAAWPLDRPTWRALLALARWLIDGAAIGCAASLAVAPILAWYFHQLNPFSVWATLLATPPLMAVLVIGLPVLLLAGIWPGGPWEGGYLLLEAGLDALAGMVDLLARAPGSLLAVPAPAPLLLLTWPLLFLPLRSRTDLVIRLLAVGGVLGVTLLLPGTVVL